MASGDPARPGSADSPMDSPVDRPTPRPDPGRTDPSDAGAAPVAPGEAAGGATAGRPRGVAQSRSLFDPEILREASVEAVRKLDPRVQIKNPVMFVVLVGSVVTLVEAIRHPSIFTWGITIWLALTVLFANFAEAMAEGRGKAQADTLRRMRTETAARKLVDGREERILASELERGDLVVCEAGDIIPSDGEIVEGVASVDESAITGESAPVIRESGGDRSAVTGGTKVLSDRIVVRITAEQGKTFLDRMIGLVEGANRQKTPNEIALTILLSALTLIFLPVVVALQPFGVYAHGHISVVILVGLLVCLIPTTIGALLSAIGIAGMDRLVQRNVLAMSGRAVEAAGDVSTLLLDKTGTITSATAWPPASCRSAVRARRSWPTWPSWPRWPTRRPRAGPSSSWRRSASACGSGSSPSRTPSFPSRPRPGCPGSTWAGG